MDLTKKRKLNENGGIEADSVSDSAELAIEDVQKIIEPFTHEQLVEIIQNAAVRHLDVLNAVRSVADKDLAQRKLFIRGLGWETTSENLRSLFSTYGELDEAVVILDKTTGKSKGFGFITYRHVDGALLALREPSKKIDGRMTVTRLASSGAPGPVTTAPVIDASSSSRKIYVGNVPADMPADSLLEHFSVYGEIEEGPLGFDKATGKFKGFALFVYKNGESARASLIDPVKRIDGHALHCKLATDGKKGKPAAASPSGSQPAGIPDGFPAGLPYVNGRGMYSGDGGPNVIPSYNTFSGGPPPLSQNPNPMYPSMVRGLGFPGGQPSFEDGGPHFGGPGFGSYGGAAVGGNGYGGGGGGGGSSMYLVPSSSSGVPTRSFPASAHYSLSSSGHQSQHSQTERPPPPSRVPTGGMLYGGARYN
jgi:heterogeneous nuclear ribonucleoprotein A1/A3